MFEPAVGRTRPYSIIKANARIVLFGFWENIIGASKNMRVHELQYSAIVFDKSSGILSRLHHFAGLLCAFIADNDPSCSLRVRDIHARIAELYEIYTNIARF